MSLHRQIMVQVNAPVDEGIAPLVSALSEIEGLETLESCQGDPGERDAFVVFKLGDWRRCAETLFGKLLPMMPPELRANVSLRLEAYDTDTARAWITMNPGAISALSDCVRRLATAPVSQGVFVTGNTHSNAVPEIIGAPGRH